MMDQDQQIGNLQNLLDDTDARFHAMRNQRDRIVKAIRELINEHKDCYSDDCNLDSHDLEHVLAEEGL